ncbi:Protein SHQ1-like protein [Yarrowia sp. C11]|nr:Protein SHQ1-like protein [Yarrowia sp. C11]KAG5364251.1 Protein SHQ1-like protein [Yarrowia sp. E02]
MITPDFTVDQDIDFVFVNIKAPHIRVANIEIVVDGELFVFSLAPYYLRLRFPGRLLDEDEEEVELVKKQIQDANLEQNKLEQSDSKSDANSSSNGLIEEVVTKPLIEEISEPSKTQSEPNSKKRNYDDMATSTLVEEVRPSKFLLEENTTQPLVEEVEKVKIKPLIEEIGGGGLLIEDITDARASDTKSATDIVSKKRPKVTKATATYDLGSSTIKCRIPKEEPGMWKDIDMIGKLLARQNETQVMDELRKTVIEELDGNEETNEGDTEPTELQEADAFDWEIKQEIPKLGEDSHVRYGWQGGYNGAVGVSVAKGNDVNEIVDPEMNGVDEEARKELRTEIEQSRFSPDYYLSDLLENDMVPEYLHYTLPKEFWAENKSDMALSGEENRVLSEIMAKSRSKSAYKNISDPKKAYIGLLNLLFSFFYDIRTTFNDHTVESPWTIGKLTPQFASLDDSFHTVSEAVVASSRRALTYPLVRSFALVVEIWKDVSKVIKSGKRAILKVLLELYKLFSVHDLYYVYADIWLKDYIGWIQYASDKVLDSLAEELDKFVLKKDMLGFDLEDWEKKAEDGELVPDEEEEKSNGDE